MSVKTEVNFDLKTNSYTSGIETETMPGENQSEFNKKNYFSIKSIVRENMPVKTKTTLSKKTVEQTQKRDKIRENFLAEHGFSPFDEEWHKLKVFWSEAKIQLRKP
jgi:hypothetical protein